MRVSICIASYDKAAYLDRALASVFRQSIPFDFEVVVVDDGSPRSDTRQVCNCHPIRYVRIDREPGFRNQSAARNLAYRVASGDVIISQADDVVHVTPDCICRLVDCLTPGKFVIATVINTNSAGQPVECYGITEYTGKTRQKPYFFLGSIYRSDVCRVGGCDEEFMVAPSYEDDWFGDCLIQGLGLAPEYRTDIIGYHLDHPRSIVEQDVLPSKYLYNRKRRAAELGKSPWQSAAGPWSYEETAVR